MEQIIKTEKDYKKIGTMGIKRLGYFSFVNGRGKETKIKVYINVNGFPVYDVLTTDYTTLRFTDLQNKYIGLRNAEETKILAELI